MIHGYHGYSQINILPIFCPPKRRQKEKTTSRIRAPYPNILKYEPIYGHDANPQTLVML